MEKRIETILDKMVKDYTLRKTEGGGYLFKTYVDYRDIDSIHEMVRDYIEDIKILEDDIEDIVSNMEMEMLEDIQGYDNNTSYIIEEFKSYTNDKELIDYFIDNFYDYIDIHYSELDHIEDTELDIDVTFSTYNERNYDMGLISDILDNGASNIEELEDTGIGVLLRYLGKDMTVWEEDSVFSQELKEELLNVCNYMNEMTIGARATIEDLIKISNKKVSKIIIDKDSITGIYSPWVGGGSILGIDLPNDIEIPITDLYKNYDDVGVVGITTSGYSGYTMEEVYGLCRSARQSIEVK